MNIMEASKQALKEDKGISNQYMADVVLIPRKKHPYTMVINNKLMMTEKNDEVWWNPTQDDLQYKHWEVVDYHIYGVKSI